MIKSSMVITFSIALLAVFSGCTKSGSTTPSMSASINDTAFSAIGSHVVSVFGNYTTVTGTNLLVPGTSVNTIISITVRDSVASYTFTEPNSNSNVNIEFSSPDTKGQTVLATSGTVNVTDTSSGVIKGTFSCVISDSFGTYTIANGQFTGTR